MSSDVFDPVGPPDSGSGFEVYPEALRGATDDVFTAIGHVAKFAQEDLASVVLKDDDVGMLGARAGLVQVFNAVIVSLRDKSERGASQLQGLADALDKAADYYETQDEEDFKRLRDLEKD